MITPKEFRHWQMLQTPEVIGGRGNRLPGARSKDMARKLGIAPESFSRYRRIGIGDQGERIMRLAMAAIAAGLEPWKMEP